MSQDFVLDGPGELEMLVFYAATEGLDAADADLAVQRAIREIGNLDDQGRKVSLLEGLPRGSADAVTALAMCYIERGEPTAEEQPVLEQFLTSAFSDQGFFHYLRVLALEGRPSALIVGLEQWGTSVEDLGALEECVVGVLPGMIQ